MSTVQLKNVKKIYPIESTEQRKQRKGADAAQPRRGNLQITEKGIVAVQEFNLDIADKEFIVLVGPSGCGKSTTLRMVAGLEEISEGELYIDNKLMNDVAPKDRDIAMVFQNYALYPHMTVLPSTSADISPLLHTVVKPRSRHQAENQQNQSNAPASGNAFEDQRLASPSHQRVCNSHLQPRSDI